MWYIDLNPRDVLLFRPRWITIKSRQMPKPPLPQSLITPEGALRAIESHWPAAPIEERPLDQCLRQILRRDVYAERDNPPFDRVCMDGIAVSSSALARGQRRFTVEAMQPAGAPPLELKERQCHRSDDRRDVAGRHRLHHPHGAVRLRSRHRDTDR